MRYLMLWCVGVWRVGGRGRGGVHLRLLSPVPHDVPIRVVDFVDPMFQFLPFPIHPSIGVELPRGCKSYFPCRGNG